MRAVPKIPENYPNVKMTLDELNMEAVEFTMPLIYTELGPIR